VLAHARGVDAAGLVVAAGRGLGRLGRGLVVVADPLAVVAEGVALVLRRDVADPPIVLALAVAADAAGLAVAGRGLGRLLVRRRLGRGLRRGLVVVADPLADCVPGRIEVGLALVLRLEEAVPPQVLALARGVDAAGLVVAGRGLGRQLERLGRLGRRLGGLVVVGADPLAEGMEAEALGLRLDVAVPPMELAEAVAADAAGLLVAAGRGLGRLLAGRRLGRRLGAVVVEGGPRGRLGVADGVLEAEEELVGVDEARAEEAGLGAVDGVDVVRGRVEAVEEPGLGRRGVVGLAEREDARDVGAGHRRARGGAVGRAGERAVDVDAGGRDVDVGAVVGEGRVDAAVLRRRDRDRFRVVARVVVAGARLVARGEDDDALARAARDDGVEVVDRVEDGLLVRAGRGVAPRVRRDVRAVVRAVDEGLGEAADGRVAEADGDHELDARVGRAVAAGDARDADAVVRVGRDGAAAVRPVPVVPEEVRPGVVGVVVAVAVVDEAVVVVVDAVVADLALVPPDVHLEVRVRHVDARVEDLDDDVLEALGHVPGALHLDRVVVRLLVELGVVGRPRRRVLELGLDQLDARVVVRVEIRLELGHHVARDGELVPGFVGTLDLVPEVEARRLVRGLVLARGPEDAGRRLVAVELRRDLAGDGVRA